ncbi:uncharacterized protein LOC102359885 isoform X1 [Latimeria chalumnae]|uniref:uncharacterized protein LOC102359885 isoform X1 n=1 Tax=Latimeria chalumnae TaxID=7897 RepID=UPI0006D93956|nr:PREDICTED: guanine nucleotide-binding protein G(I)/G(S)/G(O) subunit gamma-7 isoform X1 [Latimeria chalumnae]|eukprot:XP_014347683.1 PREDICTED: guanine nucleotide-binding protein G(I)/G(S)/G(O) subunit gamma-7 isoform X1 [Latimeria chalumnae]
MAHVDALLRGSKSWCLRSARFLYSATLAECLSDTVRRNPISSEAAVERILKTDCLFQFLRPRDLLPPATKGKNYSLRTTGASPSEGCMVET